MTLDAGGLAVGDACPGADVKTPRSEEEVAREVFGPFIDGDLVAIPDPPDFVLCRDGQVVGWAEVTTAADEVNRAFLDRLNNDGNSFPAEGLTHEWWVMFEKNAMLKDLDQDVFVEVFRRYEEEVAADEETDRPTRRGHDLVDDPEGGRELRRFGIGLTMMVEKTTEPPKVYLSQRSFASSVHSSQVNDLAEEKAAAKADSLSGRDGERHLLVLVDFDWRTGAGFALSDPDLPEGGPNLPESITDLWMASIGRLLWHYSASTGTWVVIPVETETG